MTILVVTPTLNIGGAEACALRLANRFSKHHQVHVYIMAPNAKNELTAQLAESVTLHGPPAWLLRCTQRLRNVSNRFGMNLDFGDALQRRCLRRLFRKIRPAIVNTHARHADYLISDVAQVEHVPQVVTDHGDYRQSIGQNMRIAGDANRGLRTAAAIVGISDSNIEILRGIVPMHPQIRKIYNGVEPVQDVKAVSRERCGIEPTALVFGMAARGIPEKGWEQAIEAFHRLDCRDRPLRLVLVGDGPALDALKGRFGHEPSILFAGATSDAQPWIAMFDVGVLPSYFSGESLPTFVSECLALGKPVIATYVGGVAEMLTIEAGICGQLIALDSAGKVGVATLAAAMQVYVDKPSQLKEHSRLACDAARRFDIQLAAAAYEHLFDELTCPDVNLAITDKLAEPRA